MVDFEYAKKYLNVDTDDDNEMIKAMLQESIRFCMAVARVDDIEEYWKIQNSDFAVLFSVAYKYEHREEISSKEHDINIRNLLIDREVKF